MKRKREVYLECPRCHRSYINEPIICPYCNINLALSEEVDEYDENGDYIGTDELIELRDPLHLYNTVKYIAEKFIERTNGKVELIPSIEKVHDDRYDKDETDYYYIVGYINLVGISDNRYNIGKIKVNETYNNDDTRKYIKSDLEYILKYKTNLAYKGISRKYKLKVKVKGLVK